MSVLIKMTALITSIISLFGFSSQKPQILGGDGKLITTDEIYDITDYERLEQPVENPQ